MKINVPLILKWVAVVAIIFAIFVIYPFFSAFVDRSNVRNCEAINANRRESDIRGRVLKDFIRDAAAAREAEARQHLKQAEIAQAEIDFRTAARYRILLNEIHFLPQREC